MVMNNLKEIFEKCRRLRMGDIKQYLLNIYLERKYPTVVKVFRGGDYRAAHICVVSYYNAGDALLPAVLRDLFHQTIGVREWSYMPAHKIVGSKEVKKLNNRDFIVIGGGGLFLKDTNPNNLSGWQWSCDVEHLSKIEKPLIAFAIGYNRFRGQEDFSDVFYEHINMFVKKSVFVGLRNHGSVEAIRTYLYTDELKKKVVFQPCMTTLISKLYPLLTDYKNKENFVVFNCAFDRQDMRSLDESSLISIAKVASKLSKSLKVKYYAHAESDKNILKYFENYGVKYELVDFAGKTNVKNIIKEYSKARLVVGMRGHAQMIPFGCHTPILSIVSHDKMQWFLDDVQHPEWGIDIKDKDFEEQLYSKATNMYDSYLDLQREIRTQQERLWEITMVNMNNIKQAVESKGITPPTTISNDDLSIGSTLSNSRHIRIAA